MIFLLVDQQENIIKLNLKLKQFLWLHPTQFVVKRERVRVVVELLGYYHDCINILSYFFDYLSIYGI